MLIEDQQPPRPGGPATQAGIYYQNAIAAAHLLSMLVGFDGVLSVVNESRDDRVDDIIVERHKAARKYYQVKDILEPRWTSARLIALGIFPAFAEQLKATGGPCHLVLASPQPISQLGRVANLSRACSSLEELHTHSDLTKEMRGELSTVTSQVPPSDEALRFLQSYHEECWPADATRNKGQQTMLPRQACPPVPLRQSAKRSPIPRPPPGLRATA